MKTLSRIGSGLGAPLYADECTLVVERISYAKILIEMDVMKELPSTIIVQDPSGKFFTQVVKYDWKPLYYHTCLQVGINVKWSNINLTVDKSKAK